MFLELALRRCSSRKFRAMVESSFDDATDSMPLTVLSMRLPTALILWRVRHRRLWAGRGD